MSDSPEDDSLQLAIERFANGEESALNELLRCASGRLEKLARTMLNDFSRVRRWEDTGDVIQNATIRLFRFQTTRPVDVRGFFALASLQIRRELIDLARHYFGPEGLAANHESRSDWNVADNSTASHVEAGSETLDPRRLAAWSELHEQAGQLADEERETFGLIYYQGLSHQQAAQVLGISQRTVRRRWQHARLQLHRTLQGELPSL